MWEYTKKMIFMTFGKKKASQNLGYLSPPPKKKECVESVIGEKKIQLAIGATHFEDCTPHFFSPSTL